VAAQPGHYELKTARGKILHANVAPLPAPLEITGPWEVRFPAHWGAPEQITLDHLISLSDSTNAGVKYFSGTATYTKVFDWNPPSNNGRQKSESWLDLGEVQVMAQVKLNDHDLGILWKPPFRVNISAALKPRQQHAGNPRGEPLAEPHDWRRGVAGRRNGSLGVRMSRSLLTRLCRNPACWDR
jgi:hypothetical protein